MIYAFPCVLFFVCCPSWLVILIQVDIQNQLDLFFPLYFVFCLLSWLISHFHLSRYPKPNWFMLSLVSCFSLVFLVDKSFQFKLISKTKLIYVFPCILFFVCCRSWLVILIQVHIQNQIDLFLRLYFVLRFLSWVITHFNSNSYLKPNWYILSLVFCFSFVLLVD